MLQIRTAGIALALSLLTVALAPDASGQSFDIRVEDTDGQPVQGMEVGVYSNKASYAPKTTRRDGRVRFDLEGPIMRIMVSDPGGDYAPAVKEVRYSSSAYTVQVKDTFGREEAIEMMNSALDAVGTVLDFAELSGKMSAPGSAGVPGVFSVGVQIEDGEPVLEISGTLAEQLHALLPEGYTYRGHPVK